MPIRCFRFPIRGERDLPLNVSAELEQLAADEDDLWQARYISWGSVLVCPRFFDFFTGPTEEFMGKTYRKRISGRRTRSSSLQMKEALSWLEIRKSRIQGRGIFARRDIPAGTRLIEYVGLPISKKKSDELCLKQNTYLFTVNDALDLDGKISWNPARLINHSCEPNCEANLDEEDRIWIFSIRPIARDEELTFNYGYSLENFMNHPCRCGTPACVGYMVSEEFLPVVRRLMLQPSEN
jgi:uncharacterized protein